MGELGDGSAAAHEAIGRTAASSELAMLIVIGSEADGIAEGARAGGMSVEQILRLPADAAGLAAAAGMLGDRVAPGSTILVKASRSVGLERLVETLMKQLGGVTQ
jgi:UDP-N-acetylmuramoyl-tripeptide--D-alanyl-D-alanine ligase